MAIQTLTALFDAYRDAADAVRRLEAAGVPHHDISLVSNDATHSQYYGAIPGDAGPMPDAQVSATGTGASLGTLLGGGAGLLAGLGFLAIPGLGPVMAVGWLASTLVGAGVGAAAGGLVGSLTDIGVSEVDAHAYAEGLHRGGTLLTVKADAALSARVSEILDHDTAVPMPTREGGWRGAGWDGTYVGQGAVTGAPVFSDPTMLAPGPSGSGVPPLLDVADGPGIGTAQVAIPDGEGVAPSIDLERPAAPETASIAGQPADGRSGDLTPRAFRGRVRVYDRP